MREARIELDVEEGCIEALVVCPDGPGPSPPVILLDDPAAEAAATAYKARRLAGLGFFVLAPQTPEDPVEEAFDAWLDYLAGERLTDDVRVGAVGYGASAELALQLGATHGERIAALAVFHPKPLAPQSVHHVAGCLNAVVHLGYATQDPGSTAQDGEALETALRRAGVDFEVEVYEAAAAERHWDRLAELFRRTLTSPAAETHAASEAPAP